MSMRTFTAASPEDDEHAPKPWMIGNLEKNCWDLEKSCNDMEKSSKMLEKKIQWWDWLSSRVRFWFLPMMSFLSLHQWFSKYKFCTYLPIQIRMWCIQTYFWTYFCVHIGTYTSSLVDEGWYQLTAVLNFGVFNGPNKNSNSTQFILGFQSR